MSNQTNLGILFGGRSGEHEVSLMSARSVFSVLDRSKYRVIPIGITRQGAWLTGDTPEQVIDALQNEQTNGLQRVTLLPETGQAVLYWIQAANGVQQLTPLADLDIVLSLIHGTFGEDGAIQGLLELTDLAYTGAGVLGSAVGMDKGVFKDVMRANGLPVVESITVTRRQITEDIEMVIAQAEAVGTYPLFTKPANLGSSVGITKCRTRSDLYEGLMEAAGYDRRILIERGVPNAREIEVSVLGNDLPEASIAGEIRPAGDFYTYESKYLDDRSKLIIPAPISEELTERIRQIALQAYRAIDCSGMARIDFLLDPQTNEVYLSEVNTIPGFTKISMYPKLWEAGGLSYPQLVDKLIELGLERKTDRDRTQRVYRQDQKTKGGE